MRRQFREIAVPDQVFDPVPWGPGFGLPATFLISPRRRISGLVHALGLVASSFIPNSYASGDACGCQVTLMLNSGRSCKP